MEYQVFLHIQDYDIKQRETVNPHILKQKPAKVEVEKYTRAAPTSQRSQVSTRLRKKASPTPLSFGSAVCAACLFCLHSSQL